MRDVVYSHFHVDLLLLELLLHIYWIFEDLFDKDTSYSTTKSPDSSLACATLKQLLSSTLGFGCPCVVIQTVLYLSACS